MDNNIKGCPRYDLCADSLTPDEAKECRSGKNLCSKDRRVELDYLDLIYGEIKSVGEKLSKL